MRSTSEYLWFLKNLSPDILNLGGTTPQIPDFVSSWKNEMTEPFSVDNTKALDELKKNISHMAHWPSEGIHITPGVTEGVFGLLSTLTDPGDRVLFSQPYYEPFVAAGNFLGLKIDYFDPQEYLLDAEFYKPYKMILITNPNCFTGLRCDQFIEKLASLTKAPLLVDEIYRPFSDKGKITFLNHFRLENIISVGGLSKPTGITNLRIGWVLTSPKIVEALKKFDLFIHTDMPGVAVKSALNVMKNWSSLVQFHLDDFESKRQALEGQLSHWRLSLDKLGTRYFFDIPIPSSYSTAHQLVQELQQKHKMCVIEGSFFGVPKRVRISLTGNISHLKNLFDILIQFSNGQHL